MHVAARLLQRGDEVVGIDNLSDYYDVRLKHDRLANLSAHPNFHFCKIDLAETAKTSNLFAAEKFQRVIHLAAQAGVRYSLSNPHAYINSNVVAFTNVLEMCRHHHASSSSVYGANTKTPFSVHDNVDRPVSLYAATKKSNELMAHAYSHLFQLPTTGLRFFTVYGPWGRPDMAIFLFTKAILEGTPIDVFNHGKMQRDFTYIDDVVANDVQFEAIGLQYYNPGRDMMELSRHIDRFAEFGKDIYITEMGTPSAPGDAAAVATGQVDPMNGWRGVWSEIKQADWVEYFYSIALAKEAIRMMNYWDVDDARAFIGQAGLLDGNGVPKLSFQRLKELGRKYSSS